MNHQAISALSQKFKGSPETKFFILKFLTACPDGSGRLYDLSQFSRYLGFTKPVVTRCLTELIELGWLVEERQHAGQRPFQMLASSSALQKRLLQNPGAKVLHHHQHIEQLLRWGEESLQERQHQLTINKRLVLMLLLAHADEFGIVRGLSATEISQCTGLKVSQVRNSIKLLTRHHYIAFSVPGGNFPRSMGKTTSTHVLNLRHSSFGHELLPGFTCLVSFHGSYGYSRHEAAKLCSALAHLRDQTRRAGTPERLPAKVQENPFYPFIEHGGLKITSRFESRMQWELQDIASIALNDVKIQKSTLPRTEVLIRRRLFREGMKDSTLSKEKQTQILRPVLEELSKSVGQIVARTRRILSQLPIESVEEASIQILPKQRFDRSNATSSIEVINNGQSSVDHQVLVSVVDFESLTIRKTEKAAPLNDLPVETLEGYSLGTPPIERPKLRTPPPLQKPK